MCEITNKLLHHHLVLLFSLGFNTICTHLRISFHFLAAAVGCCVSNFVTAVAVTLMEIKMKFYGNLCVFKVLLWTWKFLGRVVKFNLCILNNWRIWWPFDTHKWILRNLNQFSIRETTFHLTKPTCSPSSTSNSFHSQVFSHSHIPIQTIKFTTSNNFSF